MGYRKRSFTLNIFFALLLQFSTLIFPLITAPYVSGVLGTENLGKVNFSNSIATWFSTFAAFGTLTYGIKEVAKVRDDKQKLSKLFSELLVIKIIAAVVVIIVYLPSIFIIPRLSGEIFLYLVQGTILILNIFSLDWFFQGVEDYAYITIRSVLFKAISILAIFMMVNQKSDYIIYAAISIVALSASNVLNFLYSRKHVVIRFSDINIKQHIKPLSIFFVSSFVISLYGTFDQVLLGFFKGDAPVALFARAKMINGIGLGLLLAISNVFLPRINNYFITNPERYKELLNVSLGIILLFAVPISMGLIALSPQINTLLGGASDFSGAIVPLQIIALTNVIVSVGTWNYQQRLIPLNLERMGLLFQITMAIVSLVLNLSLIGLFGVVGTAIAWLMAEFIGSVVGFIYTYKKDHINIFNWGQIKFVIAGTVMAVLINKMLPLFTFSWINLLLFVVLGGGVYFICLALVKEKTLKFVLKELKTLLIFSKQKKEEKALNESQQKHGDKRDE